MSSNRCLAGCGSSALARCAGPQVYDRLQAMALYSPVAGNQDGSYLTMWSVGGLQFEIIFFFSAVAQMVVDQSYWQSAIAAKPTAAVKVPAPAFQPLRAAHLSYTAPAVLRGDTLLAA